MEFVISFSGGKDSCAMLHYLCIHYPNIKKHVVFANTGWEHPDAEQWCTAMAARFKLALHVVKNPNKDFFDMVRHRKKFPSASTRQCTSDLKRGPIYRWIRNNCTGKYIINCMGLRSEESISRKKRPKLCVNKGMTNGKRKVWDWLPIKDWTTQQVYNLHYMHNIPLHPVYKYLKRFSCRICIFMTIHDLQQVRIHDPEAFERFAALEREINFSMRPDMFLDELPKQIQMTLFL